MDNSITHLCIYAVTVSTTSQNQPAKKLDPDISNELKGDCRGWVQLRVNPLYGLGGNTHNMSCYPFTFAFELNHVRMCLVFLFWSNNNMNKLDITILKYTHVQIDIILKIYRSRAHHESSVHPQRVQWLCQTWGTVHTAPRLPGSLPAAGPAASPPGHYPWTLTHTNGDSTCTHTHTHTHELSKSFI